jgi:hypothetical protein
MMWPRGATEEPLEVPMRTRWRSKLALVAIAAAIAVGAVAELAVRLLVEQPVAEGDILGADGEREDQGGRHGEAGQDGRGQLDCTHHDCPLASFLFPPRLRGGLGWSKPATWVTE